jgi:hypothetical protein
VSRLRSPGFQSSRRRSGFASTARSSVARVSGPYGFAAPPQSLVRSLPASCIARWPRPENCLKPYTPSLPMAQPCPSSTRHRLQWCSGEA